MKVLVTGAAGFIGMHVRRLLLARGDEVVGVDNLNDYYDVTLEEARLARLAPDPAPSWAPWRVFNIGNQQAADLMAYIEALEQAMGKTAKRNSLPLQDGDVPATCADTSEPERVTGFLPATSLTGDVRRLVEWYRGYHA